MPNRQIPVSSRLSDVRYEIRGELFERALALEAQGHVVHKLNIGNPASFGFKTPAHLGAEIRARLEDSEGYCHQRGLTEPRVVIADQARARGAANVDPERTWIGNGVSELIDLALRALLNHGDEVLVPSPDYPLWTASVLLNGGIAVHYPCRPEAGFVPDPAEIEALITPRTRALVLINPNNPTGAVYPPERVAALAALAVRHRLVLLSDEIYDGLLYDKAGFEPVARHGSETVCLSFGGLSKVYRACGYRVGWMVMSGDVRRANDLRHAIELLAALRLCSNVPGQWAIVPALTGPDSASALTAPGGRLFETRRAVIDGVRASRHLDLVTPAGALYAFPGVPGATPAQFDDRRFALDLLEQEQVLLVPGSSFNVPYRNHFRITLLPDAALMRDVLERIERVLVRTLERPEDARQVA